MQPFRLGFVGAGFIADLTARALTQVRHAELSAVYAEAGAAELQAFALAHDLGPCRVCTSVVELCRNCDAVLILVPNFARLEVMRLIKTAVDAGAQLKGLICEKPLAATVNEAMEMVALAKAMGLPTAYFENQCGMKGVNNILAQVAPLAEQQGWFSWVEASEQHPGPHKSWFWDPTKSGGGALGDMACHCIGVGWHMLTPPGKPADFLHPVSVSAHTYLLKWGLPNWRRVLLERWGVDYWQTPAEDLGTGIVTFRNPESGQHVHCRFQSSWMYDMMALELVMKGLGPGYAVDYNSLQTSGHVFIGNDAAQAAADAERAVEKAASDRGLLVVHDNEPDKYGHTDEIEAAIAAFRQGTSPRYDWAWGLTIVELVQAAYWSAQSGRIFDFTDPGRRRSLQGWQSLIAKGRGAEVLFPGGVAPKA